MSADSTFLRKFSVIRRVREVSGIVPKDFPKDTADSATEKGEDREREREGGKGAEEGEASGMLGEREPRNLLQAILPTTRRGSRGMGKARVSCPRNVFYSDRRCGSSHATATLLTLFRVAVGFK